MWTSADMPDLSGQTFVVTGGNSGIGHEAALQFAGKGATTILACRDVARAGEAVARIKATFSTAAVEAMQLDLASLASVRSFAEAFLRRYGSLHVLCNNAGVMALPYCMTADGFEMQFGTNHLGHFALTGLLLERLLATPGSRVVNVSSTAHRFGVMHFDDLQGQKRYRKWHAYGQSKLANLLFTYELQARLKRAGAGTISVACHPGYAATNLQPASARMTGSRLIEAITDLGSRLLAQSAAMGSLPTQYAATAPDVRGGDYIGPDGFLENTGYPKKTTSNARSHDRTAAEKLWKVSVELTGVGFEALANAALTN
jgi:hypothetical protein